MSMFFIAGVIGADLITSNMSKITTIDKATRDYLLTKVEVGKAQEIKPNIKIDCYDTACIWSAEQSGIIQTYGNVIDRNYCTDGKVKVVGSQVQFTCTKPAIYTLAEIEDKVTQIVVNTISANAKSEMTIKPIVEGSTGTIEIWENKTRRK